jgi:hypothetical protein
MHRSATKSCQDEILSRCRSRINSRSNRANDHITLRSRFAIGESPSAKVEAFFKQPGVNLLIAMKQ